MPFKEPQDKLVDNGNRFLATKEQYVADLQTAIRQASLDEIIVASYADSDFIDDRPTTRFDDAHDLYLLHDRFADRTEAAQVMQYACADALVERVHGEVEYDGGLRDATLETLQSYSLETLPFAVQAIGRDYVATSVKHQALITEHGMHGVADFEQKAEQLVRQKLALVEAFSHVGIAHGVDEAAGHKVYGFIANQRVRIEEGTIDTSALRQLKALDLLAEEAFHLRLNKAGEYVNDDSIEDVSMRAVKADAHRLSAGRRIGLATTITAFGLGLVNTSSAAAAPIPSQQIAMAEGNVAEATASQSVKITFAPTTEANYVVADYVIPAVAPGSDVASGKSANERNLKPQTNAKPPVVELDPSAMAAIADDEVWLADITKPATNTHAEVAPVAELPPAAIVAESGAYIVPAVVQAAPAEESKPAEVKKDAIEPVIVNGVGITEPTGQSESNSAETPEAVPALPEDADFMVPIPEAPAETPSEAAPAPEANPAPVEKAPEAKPSTPEVKKLTPAERWTKAAEYAGKLNKWGTYKRWVVEETVEQTLENGGSLVGAAGFIGSAKGESNYVPGIVERGNGIGLGIFQHSFGRRDNLEAKAEKAKVNPYKNTRKNVEFQVGFSIGESLKRTERDGSGNEWAGLNKIKNPAKAAAFFQWNFERPAEVATQSVRTEEATNVYNQIIAADKVLQAKAAAEAKAKAAAATKAKAKADAAKSKARAESDTKFKVVNGPVSKAGYGAPLGPKDLAKVPLTARYDGYSKKFSNEYKEKNGVYPHHDGLDYATEIGTEVLAVDDATVVRVGDYRDGQDLQAIMLDHGYDEKGRHIMTNYEHLKPGSFKVKQGDKINRGTVIALSGISGTDGAHTHVTFITDDPNKDGRVGVTNPNFKEQTDNPELYFPDAQDAKNYLAGKKSN